LATNHIGKKGGRGKKMSNLQSKEIGKTGGGEKRGRGPKVYRIIPPEGEGQQDR